MAKVSGGTRLSDTNSRQSASETIRKILSDIKSEGFSKVTPFKIGNVDRRMKEYANINNIVLGSNDVYMSSDAIAHATRDSKKAKGIAVSDEELTKFPESRKKMALYYDKDVKTFLYVSATSKFVVHPNYRIKTEKGKTKVVNFITAQKLSKGENFNGKRFDKI